MSAKHELNRFNLRVYGICIREDCLLITDEVRGGFPMTKLPGGGLEFGEGLEDCLRREWREELSVEIEVGKVFFVNPFLIQSAFNPRDQVICFYYQVDLLGEPEGHFATLPMDFPAGERGDLQAFRWLPLSRVDESIFTFPSDKALVRELRGLNFLPPDDQDFRR